MTSRLPSNRNIDGTAVVKEALRLVDQPTRRLLLKRSLTIGGLSLPSRCTIVDSDSVERALMRISRFNERAQAFIFRPEEARTDLSRCDDHPPLSVQCLLQ